MKNMVRSTNIKLLHCSKNLLHECNVRVSWCVLSRNVDNSGIRSSEKADGGENR